MSIWKMFSARLHVTDEYVRCERTVQCRERGEKARASHLLCVKVCVLHVCVAENKMKNSHREREMARERKEEYPSWHCFRPVKTEGQLYFNLPTKKCLSASWYLNFHALFQ